MKKPTFRLHPLFQRHVLLSDCYQAQRLCKSSEGQFPLIVLIRKLPDLVSWLGCYCCCCSAIVKKKLLSL